GNFTVNVYSGLRVQPDRVAIDLVVDMAEIPTFQARRDIDTNGDATVSDAEASAYAAKACPQAAQRIDLSVGAKAVPVRADGPGRVTFPTGQGGLATMRLECPLGATTGEASRERVVSFRNRNYDDRVGWREIVAVGDRTSLVASNVPTTSLS